VQINNKIHRTLVFIAILQIMILAPIGILSSNAFAQILHNQTLYEVAKQTSGLNENAHIDVGSSPVSIGVLENKVTLTYTVYVANSGSNTVSVISAENNTKIGEDISVGEAPAAIGVDQASGTVYVANSFSNTVSVIAENHTRIQDVPVGEAPQYMAVDQLSGTVYVANDLSNTVSVISGENHTKIQDIPVGDGPVGVGVSVILFTVYVANHGSDSISVIDGATNKVVAGVTFHVNPFNSGHILCDGLTTPSPVGQYLYVYSGAECIAKPNEGFDFVS
jgi:YVTN family beta-propeller protein